jgi:hypothetical protein
MIADSSGFLPRGAATGLWRRGCALLLRSPWPVGVRSRGDHHRVVEQWKGREGAGRPRSRTERGRCGGWGDARGGRSRWRGAGECRWRGGDDAVGALTHPMVHLPWGSPQASAPPAPPPPVPRLPRPPSAPHLLRPSSRPPSAVVPPARRFAPLTLPRPFSSISLRGSPGGPLLSPSSSRASFSTPDPWRPPRCRIVLPTSRLVPSPPPTRHQPYINPSRLLNPPPIPWPRYRWSLSVMTGECIGWVWPTPNRRGTCGTRAASSSGPLLVPIAA